MIDFALLMPWLEFAVRWLHVITAIAWIGSSFYFIALDLGLREAPGQPAGVKGEEWQVHGGGFYHIRKFTVAPERMPEDLTWFKWESYATWLSGFALLVLMYYVGAELYLVDPTVRDLPVWAAVAISLGSLALGWLLYDLICRSPLGADNTRLMVLLFVILVAMSWGYAQVFSGRAALLHLGAFTATIMSANVFLVIIPNKKIVVDDMKDRKNAPTSEIRVRCQAALDPHNYLRIYVIFLNLSNHYTLAFDRNDQARLELGDRETGVPDGRDDPALLQDLTPPGGTRGGTPNWTWAERPALLCRASHRRCRSAA